MNHIENDIELDRLRASWYVNLVLEATGGNSDFAEMMGEEYVNGVSVLFALRSAQLPIAAVIQEDLQRIERGVEPRYFVPHRVMADRYRQRTGVHLDEHRRFMHIRDVVAAVLRQIELAQTEYENHGVSLSELRAGLACRREQAAFYASCEWEDRAKVVRMQARFRCDRCGTGARELEAHHNEPIYSAYSRLFNRNFDTGRISALCTACHKQFHAERAKTSDGFVLMTNAGKADSARIWRKVEWLHDEVKECAYCLANVWKEVLA